MFAAARQTIAPVIGRYRWRMSDAGSSVCASIGSALRERPLRTYGYTVESVFAPFLLYPIVDGSLSRPWLC